MTFPKKDLSEAVRIGELSKRTGVNIETIRFYERAGVMPSPPRSKKGYRLYPPALERRLHFIKRTRDLGFPLKDVRVLLALAEAKSTDCDHAKSVAEEHLAMIRQRLGDLRHLESVLSDLVDRCADSERVSCPLIETLFETASR